MSCFFSLWTQLFVLNHLQAGFAPHCKILSKSLVIEVCLLPFPGLLGVDSSCVNWEAACFSLSLFLFLQTAELAVPVDPHGSQCLSRKLGSLVRSTNQRSFWESTAGCGRIKPLRVVALAAFIPPFFSFHISFITDLTCPSLMPFFQGSLSLLQVNFHKSSSFKH